MTGKWMKRGRWKVSHLVREDGQTHWNNRTVARTACGSFITVDDDLSDEPTGIDTLDRCGRCERTLSRLGGDS